MDDNRKEKEKITTNYNRDQREQRAENTINKATLREIIKEILKANDDLDFLLKLPEDELKTLVGCLRERLDQYER